MANFTDRCATRRYSRRFDWIQKFTRSSGLRERTSTLPHCMTGRSTKPRSAPQEDLVKRFYTGYIPHVTVLNRDGKIAYNASGEVEEGEISKVLDKTLK